MIASIRGKVLFNTDFLIIETAGVGYKIHVPTTVLASISLGDVIQVFTHQHIREDAVDLYGFASFTELDLFEELISVSGVGPKAGLALLSQFSAAQLQESIVIGDTSLLTKVSGIGKKTAERLILELKGSFSERATNLNADIQSSDVVVTALEQLGYTGQEVLQAIQHIDRSLSEADQIKAALQYLSHGR